jgi:hypothetical protein
MGGAPKLIQKALATLQKSLYGKQSLTISVPVQHKVVNLTKETVSICSSTWNLANVEHGWVATVKKCALDVTPTYVFIGTLAIKCIQPTDNDKITVTRADFKMARGLQTLQARYKFRYLTKIRWRRQAEEKGALRFQSLLRGYFLRRKVKCAECSRSFKAAQVEMACRSCPHVHCKGCLRKAMENADNNFFHCRRCKLFSPLKISSLERFFSKPDLTEYVQKCQSRLEKVCGRQSEAPAGFKRDDVIASFYNVLPSIQIETVYQTSLDFKEIGLVVENHCAKPSHATLTINAWSHRVNSANLWYSKPELGDGELKVNVRDPLDRFVGMVDNSIMSETNHGYPHLIFLLDLGQNIQDEMCRIKREAATKLQSLARKFLAKIQFECEICYRSLPKYALTRRMSVHCDHRYCLQCLESYTRSCDDDSRWDITCPGPKCIQPLADELIREFIPGFNSKERREKILLSQKEHLISVLTSGENSFTNLVRKDSRVCPKCYVILHRYEGCPQMRCRCGHSFCYDIHEASLQHYEATLKETATLEPPTPLGV